MDTVSAFNLTAWIFNRLQLVPAEFFWGPALSACRLEGNVIGLRYI